MYKDQTSWQCSSRLPTLALLLPNYVLFSDQLLEFNEGNTRPYAILSHTWRANEVTCQEMSFLQKLDHLTDKLRQDMLYVSSLVAAAGLDFSEAHVDSIKSRKGYTKIEKKTAQKIASARGLDYFWPETCCIEKSSSAELQEAINTMYQRYEDSTYCVVHLEDQR